MSKRAGYTLIEILIALSVFAILSTMTAYALNHMSTTQNIIKKHDNALTRLQLALMLIRRDIQQAVDRPVRGNDMHLFPPFIGQPEYLEFTRNGLVNPDHQKIMSNLERIAYRCDGQKLIRRTWQVVDTPDRRQTQDKIILDDLTHCAFDYLAKNHQLLHAWEGFAIQQNQTHATLPSAIRLSLTLSDQGPLSVLMIIPEGLYSD